MTSLRILCTSFIVALTASGCAHSVHAPQVAVKSSVTQTEDAHSKLPSPSPPGPKEQPCVDLDTESSIDARTVEAWRAAVAGHKEESLKILADLERKYPNVSTVHFMKGQVLDKLGMRKEAIAYYRQSIAAGQFTFMHLFKLAEDLRTTGDAKAAVAEYRKALELQPDFGPAKLGLAQSLTKLDPHSVEAKEQIEAVLASEPSNERAKSLITELQKKEHTQSQH